MNNRILIVDDDHDFRSLLSDLYTQADYQVKSVGNPLDALKFLSEESFSLCVTDQSMPELKGIDFIDKCRTMKPNMPIIMVSAYLSEEVTTKLRTQRIEVFHKPLNIMSLLRKTSELIKNANAAPQSPAGNTNSLAREKTTLSPISQTTSDKPKFKSFAFKSEAAKRLKKEFESIGDELPNMVLVADEGTHFHRICQDIEAQVNPEAHHFMYVVNKKINVFDLSKGISDIPSSKALVFALTEAQLMGVAQKQALMKLHKRTGPFSDIRNPIKFIFCLNEDLDTQFAKGAIDQDFYLIMGQKEIYVPRLDLCKEDIPDLSREIATELTQNGSVSENFAGFSSDATEILIQADWPSNYASLEATIAKALKLAKGSTITRDHLEKAIASPGKIQQPIPSNTPIPTQTQAISTGTTVNTPKSNINKTTSSTAGTQSPLKRPRTDTQRRSSSSQAQCIQSFTILDDETELAKSILEEITQR